MQFCIGRKWSTNRSTDIEENSARKSAGVKENTAVLRENLENEYRCAVIIQRAYEQKRRVGEWKIMQQEGEHDEKIEDFICMRSRTG